jgi:hypothetical protein
MPIIYIGSYAYVLSTCQCVWLLIIFMRLIDFYKICCEYYTTTYHTVFFVLQFPVVSSTNMPVMRMPEVDVALVRILKFCVVVDFEKYRIYFV